ncbi:MAG: hypothetical protein M3457_16825 [Chloroflexota bacterium]|nr:hypothetical protein [Chloroflexota bacterium]
MDAQLARPSLKGCQLNEYDIVEVTSDHPELTPALTMGTQGVIVDLPENSSLAAVEFALPDDIEVFLLELDELRLVDVANRQGHKTPLD